ncbi:MAG: DUF1499 domain-containing protein [Burkholderiales bacterium]|jgi:uncharacterized protein (DUF1499 family)|nr:DUF1499 domain-containing protein [Burkholderiales bacterium]
MGWFTGRRPADLGVRDGRLKALPASPNAVGSQAPAGSAGFVEPLRTRLPREQVIAELATIVRAMPRTLIVTQTHDYLYAEFTSALMGYVDDVEFVLAPEPGVVHVRSASRLGTSDFGVNRRRIEDIRAALAARAP